MKTIFNKALWASAIGACTLSLGSCTDLSETIYDTIASEKYEFTEKDRAAMFAPVYSSLRDVRSEERRVGKECRCGGWPCH